MFLMQLVFLCMRNSIQCTWPWKALGLERKRIYVERQNLEARRMPSGWLLPLDFISFLKLSSRCPSIGLHKAFSFCSVLCILTLSWHPVSTHCEEQLLDSVYEELKAKINLNSTSTPSGIFLFALYHLHMATEALPKQTGKSWKRDL